jgi:hypothetical protein
MILWFLKTEKMLLQRNLIFKNIHITRRFLCDFMVFENMENFNLFLKTGNKKNGFLKTTITGDFQACFMVFENWKKLIMVFENGLL